jgi:hypothetical protein
MRSRDLQSYRLVRSDAEPGIGFLIPEHEEIPSSLSEAEWVPMGQALLPRVPLGGQPRGTGGCSLAPVDRTDERTDPFKDRRE